MRELKRWIDGITDAEYRYSVPESIYETYQLLEAMPAFSELHTSHLEASLLPPDGMRIQAKDHDWQPLDVHSMAERQRFLEYLRDRYCRRLGFESMMEWYLYCMGFGRRSVKTGP